MAKKPEEVSFWTDADISAIQAQGQKLRDNPRSIIPPLVGRGQRPETSGRDVLLSALMGLRGSMQASQQAAQLGDPVLASLAAIGGAAGQPGPDAIAMQREEMARQQQMAQLESTPIDDVSPDLVAQYPELKGMPLGLIQKITPLIAETGRKKRAEMVAHAASGAVGSLYTDPDTGMMFRIKPGHKGNELIPLPGQSIGPDGKVLFASEERDRAAERPKEIGAEAGVKVSLARNGLSNIDDMRKALSGPDARGLILKAGGSWKKLSSLGDPRAEALANAIFEVADAEARIKTGAAINEKEVEAYFNGLVPKTGTLEGILDRLNRKQKYFESIDDTLSANKRIARRQGGAPAMVRIQAPDGSIGYVPQDQEKAAIAAGGKRL